MDNRLTSISASTSRVHEAVVLGRIDKTVRRTSAMRHSHIVCLNARKSWHSPPERLSVHCLEHFERKHGGVYTSGL